uniref:Uncharacterized protein n=1 Tax=Anguilla anguilla TaxID=7936 RepID=A0A0E9Q5D7_ANGAN
MARTAVCKVIQVHQSFCHVPYQAGISSSRA